MLVTVCEYNKFLAADHLLLGNFVLFVWNSLLLNTGYIIQCPPS